MPKVRYSNKAVEDLSSIWDYTFTQWSENHADRYVNYDDCLAVIIFVFFKESSQARKLTFGVAC